MSKGEAEWIESEYRDFPLFSAVNRFVKDVAGIEDIPAVHPSLLFYLVVYAIDDIKCIGYQPRRLTKCKDLKNDLVYYLKKNRYDNQDILAAGVIYCVRYSLGALSNMGYKKEEIIMCEHINELTTDNAKNADIRATARKCFWEDEEFKEWIKSYYNGRDYMSETITSMIMEMRKANPPKEDSADKKGRGNRNSELFSNDELKKEMQNEIKKRFKGKGLRITDIKVTNNSKELKCLIEFYEYLKTDNKIDDYDNPRGYIRFLRDGGFSFATGDKNVESKFRKCMRKD